MFCQILAWRGLFHSHHEKLNILLEPHSSWKFTKCDDQFSQFTKVWSRFITIYACTQWCHSRCYQTKTMPLTYNYNILVHLFNCQEWLENTSYVGNIWHQYQRCGHPWWAGRGGGVQDGCSLFHSFSVALHLQQCQRYKHRHDGLLRSALLPKMWLEQGVIWY